MEPERCILRKMETHLQKHQFGASMLIFQGVLVVDLTVLMLPPKAITAPPRNTTSSFSQRGARALSTKPNALSKAMKVPVRSRGPYVTPFIGGKTL